MLRHKIIQRKNNKNTIKKTLKQKQFKKMKKMKLIKFQYSLIINNTNNQINFTFKGIRNSMNI